MATFWLQLALLPLLLLLCHPPPVRGQTYYTALHQSKIAGTEPSKYAAHSCHCKVTCAVRSDCLAVAFDDSDSTCHISTGPQTSITTAALATGTTWFKFVYTPASVGSTSSSTPPPTIILSSVFVKSATVANLFAACASSGGTPANLLTQVNKDEAVALVNDKGFLNLPSDLRYAWLIAKDYDGDGAFEWSDGTPVTAAVFTTKDFTGNGSSALLRSDGFIEQCTTNPTYACPVVCFP